MIAVEAPGRRGDGENWKGAPLTDVTRGPQPLTKPAGMDRARGRLTCSFPGPYFLDAGLRIGGAIPDIVVEGPARRGASPNL